MEDRRIPRGVIKDKSEYEEHIKIRRKIEDEIQWLNNSKNPLEETVNRIKKCLTELEQLKKTENMSVISEEVTDDEKL